MAKKHRTIQPFTWARPKGYANGLLTEGRTLFVGGQVGWIPQSPTPTFGATFAEQFEQALSNVVAVVREAGGTPDTVARVTIYVTDKREYQASLKDVGRAWKKHLGSHFPAMSLVEVRALLEDAAKVEIEATAVL